MKNSLRSKLILSYLAVAVFTILAVVLVIRLTSDQSIRQMVVDQQVEALSTDLKNYYVENGDLEGFLGYYWFSNVSPQNQSPADEFSPRPDDKVDFRGLSALVDPDGVVILPFPGFEVGSRVPQEIYRKGQEVKVDQQTIAWILIDESKQFTLSPQEQRFTERVNLAIVLGTAAGLLLAVLTGILLANNLIKPIQRLTKASAKMASGEIGQQVPVSSGDEIGQLTESFNSMSQEIARADLQRKQLTADITHDLSTPIQIISGYIEMVENGEVTLKEQNLEIIKTELGNLRRLVGDLTTLAQVEAGGLDLQKEIIHPNDLLKSTWNAYNLIAEKENKKLVLDLDETSAWVNVDEGRMTQILKNLTENALRYTPPEGTINLRSRIGQEVELSVSDSGQGIDQVDLPYIFDRFYQADKARTGGKGKMGLGLAICKALTEAQEVKLRAESDGLGKGSSFILSIPKVSKDL